MTEIVIAAPTLQRLVELTRSDMEQGAALFLQSCRDGQRMLVSAVEIAAPVDVLASTSREITFAPQFLTRVTRRAREAGNCIAILHTHPTGFRSFSSRDDDTEQELAPFMAKRNPGRDSFSMMLCDGKLIARRFGQQDAVPVRVVGETVDILGGVSLADEEASLYDRQVRAFGDRGQEILKSLRVALVGLGGTGSVTAQQLAHLGVGSFLLIDPDVIEKTNLNRVVGAAPQSVGQRKVDSTARLIQAVHPTAMVQTAAGNVMTEGGRRLLSSADAIFICTDSHVSRAFVNELAYQYLIPAFDMGVSINARDGVVQAITGRTEMLAPGLPCLLCSSALSAQRIREELMTPEQRAADPYFNEGSVVQPAVISINSTMASLAVTMFLQAFTGVPGRSRWQSYDGIAGTVRKFSASCDPECPVCGTDGVTAKGDERRLSFLGEVDE
jgi:molybdopterin/thiamine biosynthesis adenylyltransferase/proteasome lid subunit RPN8/RPN11